MNSPTARVALEKKGRRLAQCKPPAAARVRFSERANTPGRVFMGHEPRRDRVSNPPNREEHRFRRLAVDGATRLHSFEDLSEAIRNVQARRAHIQVRRSRHRAGTLQSRRACAVRCGSDRYASTQLGHCHPQSR